MWKGKRTEKLDVLYDEYYEKFGCEPDWYDEVNYQMMSYEEYVAYIEEAIDIGEELPDILK